MLQASTALSPLWAAHELGMEYSVAVMLGAAECNQRPDGVMPFLHAQGCPWDTTVPVAAVQRGAFQMLCWLIQRGCPCTGHIVLRAAAESGNIALTSWIRRQLGVALSEYTMAAAAANGRTAMCAYLRSKQCPWNASASDAAARNGHVKTLHWLIKRGCPGCAVVHCREAALGGSVEVMLYIQQQFGRRGIVTPSALLTEMLNIAGANNRLAAAVWLRQQGAEWPSVLKYYGRLWSGETLAWARSQGCTSPTE
jgi:hypothetical protein